MTEKEINYAHKWCRQNLGYVPTEEEWLAVNEEEPGLVKLFMHVMNNQFHHRHTKKDLYSYDKEPMADDKLKEEYMGAWYGKAKKRP